MLAAVLGIGVAAPAFAKAEPGSTRGGEVTKVGWWWVANQPPAETGLVAYPQQSPPNIPAGHLPVAATAGEPDKVVALELRLAAKPGSLVESATVVLQESASPGANANAESAKILACPVTEAFWADGAAARWDGKPTYDCDLAQAAGVRDEKGLWTFDLTMLASTWLGEGATGSPSFVLVEGADAPDSFQVTFAGLEDKGIGFVAKFLPPGAGTAPTTGAAGTGPVAAAPSGLGAGGSAGGTGTSGAAALSGSLTPAGETGTDAIPVDSGSAQTTDPVAAATVPVAAPAAVRPWYSGLPTGSVLLAPFALGLAYLAMLALGPDAQPSTAASQHGVSRALERLRLAGAQAVAGVRR
jgi:hypothetical protein